MGESKVLAVFAKNLKDARRKKAISQEKLAFECGFDRTYISLLERGKRNPSLTTINKIAKKLGIPPGELL